MLLIKKIFLTFVLGLGWLDHQLKAEALPVALAFVAQTSISNAMENQKEIWKDIIGYEGLYQVSSFGNVKGLDRIVPYKNGMPRNIKGRILKPGDSKGYLKIVLCKNSKMNSRSIHQLVAEAFLNHKPSGHNGLVVNHKDFNRHSNNLYNLEIVTPRENSNKIHIKSSSSYRGVSWHEVHKKWISRIVFNGETIYLGIFTNEKEASEYYENALIAIGKGVEIKTKKHKLSNQYKGVSWYERDKKWSAYLTVNKKRINLGRFKNELDAYKSILEYKTNSKN